jgi:D-aspartate ligase
MGLAATALPVIRDLGRSGVPVFAVGSPSEPARFSRYVSGFHAHSTDDELTAFLEGLGRRAGAPPVLFPCSDDFLDYILRNEDALRHLARYPASFGDGSAATLLDKIQFYRAMQEKGFAVPKLHVLAHGDPSFRPEASGLRYPIIAKPSEVHRIRDVMKGNKLFVIRNDEEWERFSRSPVFEATAWMAQEIIPGPESEIVLAAGYVDKGGNVETVATARKLRQYPPGFGNASLVRSERLEAMETLARRIMASLGYTGIFALEAKRDPRDGQLKTIEINPRFSLWFSIVSVMGFRLACKAYSDLAGVEIPSGSCVNGNVVWRYFSRDLYSKYFYRTKGRSFVLPAPEIGSLLGAPSRRSGALWELRDPLPALVEPLGVMRKLWSRR